MWRLGQFLEENEHWQNDDVVSLTAVKDQWKKKKQEKQKGKYEMYWEKQNEINFH